MKQAYYFSMYFLFLLVFLNEFFSIPIKLFMLLSSLGIIIFLVSSLYMTRGFQLYVSLASLLVGHIIFLKYNLSIDVWYNSMMKGLGMPVLFVAIPLISFPIKYGHYLESIENYVVAKREKPGFLFSFLALMHLALTVALNIGSIPTMQKLLERVKFPTKYLSLLYTAGYSSYMVFSPYDAAVNMVLLFTAVSYSEYFLSASAMVILIILVSALFLKTDTKLLGELNQNLSYSKENGNHKKVYELLMHIFILIFLAFIGDRYIHFSNALYTITAIIIIYSLIWGFLLRILGQYKNELSDYSSNLLSCKSFLPFLISASFLGALVSYTPLKESIEGILLSLNSLPLYLIIQGFLLLTMLLCLIGIHMMISVTTLALTVTPELIGLSNSAFALTLLTCWYMAMCISPFVPFTLIVAETINEKPLNIAFKHNLKFCLVMIFLAPALILLLNKIV